MDEPARRRIGRVLFLSGTHRVVSGLPDDVFDELVNLAAGRAWTERFDPRVLRAQHNVVDPPDLRRRLAFRDGARHIGPVTRPFVLREDVHDDRLARVERAGPDLMRVGRLRARRADRAVRGVTALEQRRLDDRAQPLGREHGSVKLERAVRSRFGAAKGIDAFAPGILGRTLCRLDRLDLVGALGSSAVAKIVRDNKLDAHLAQPVGFGDREVRRDRDPPQTALVEEPLDDRCPELGARDAAGGQVLRAVLVHVDDARRARFLARASFLERACDEHELLDVLEGDDRIGREEFGRVIDVGKAISVGVEEERKAACDRGVVGAAGTRHFRLLSAGATGRSGPRPAEDRSPRSARRPRSMHRVRRLAARSRRSFRRSDPSRSSRTGSPA